MCLAGAAVLAVSLLAGAPLAAEVTYTGTAVNQNFGSQNIGSTSTAKTFNFSVAAGTTVGSIGVVTQGAPNLDFTEATGGTCAAQEYTTTAACTVNVTFKPRFAGTRYGAVVFFSEAGNTGTVLGSAPVYGVGTGPQIAFAPATATAIAPTVNGLSLSSPSSVALDGAGDLFIADQGNDRVVEVPAHGGAPAAIDPTVNGLSLSSPSSVALDGAGDLFIADQGNDRVVEVPAGGSTPIAIGPSVVFPPLSQPSALALDGAGDLFILDSWGRIVEMPADGGAPMITSCEPIGSYWLDMEGPTGLAVDEAGDLFIVDGGNDRVVEVPAGGGSPAAIGLGYIDIGYGIAVDGVGDLYVSVLSAEHGYSAVVEISSGGAPAILPTVNGDGLNASNPPRGLALDGVGNLFIADTGNNRVVEVQRSQPPALSFANTIDGQVSSDSPQTVTVQNIGTSALDFTAVSYPADFPEASDVDTDCTIAKTVASGADCTLSIDFSPLPTSATGFTTSLSESVSLTDNNLNVTSAVQSVAVSGTEIAEPALISPSVSPLLGATTFTWNPGAGSTMFALWIGTSPGTYNVYTSGHVANTVTSETVNIPANGATLYVSLWYEVNNDWTYKAYTFFEGGPPALTSPSSSPLGGPTQFNWNPGSESTMFALWIGTSPETYNVYTSGHVANTVTSETVYIPAYGATLYVSLWYEINGAWVYKSYTFTEAPPPSLTSPTTSPLSGSTTFTWSPGTESTMFALWIGTTPGTRDFYTSGHVANTVTSETVNIPAGGQTLYVSLWYEMNGYWTYESYTFTEAP